MRQVLIAEDYAQEAKALAALLDRWGYDPIVVADGLAAVDVLKSQDGPRLALIDWGLPVMNGIEVCQELRSQPARPYTYIVLVTGRGGRDHRVTGLEAGADDFLTKPIDPAELRARLKTAERILGLEHRLLETQAILKEQAMRDSLTGLWNRAAILEILDRELVRSRRDTNSVAVLLGDLDHFKRINDTYGHLAGDLALKEFSQRILNALRPYDSVGRYGGEEFLVVLPGCEADQLLSLAERLRNEIASSPFCVGGGHTCLTISLGGACQSPGQAGDVATLIGAADAALYQAKGLGRNQAAIATAGTVS